MRRGEASAEKKDEVDEEVDESEDEDAVGTVLLAVEGFGFSASAARPAAERPLDEVAIALGADLVAGAAAAGLVFRGDGSCA